MKRLILSVLLMAFAVAVNAGEGKTCQDKAAGGCCANKAKTSVSTSASQDKAQGDSGCCASKMKTSVEAKGGCPFAASACGMQAPTKQTAAAKQPSLSSPKAASYASK